MSTPVLSQPPADAAPSRAADDPARIGRFQVRRLLGRGAHGAVYLARDPQLERDVAVKLLGAGVDPKAALAEARTVGRLRHANLVPVFEAAEHEGRICLVYEYVEGCTLAQLLRDKGTLPGHRAAELMCGVLDALEEAHRQQLVHRDLKPSNILVSAQGEARVTDFGIAAPLSAGTPGEQPLCGTPAYMAPEYIARREVTPQADLFAAGLVLYEMVLGRRAVRSDSVFQTLHRIANEDLVWPEDEADVDEALRSVILKATARDPVSRYASATQMRQALDEYLAPAGDGATDAAAGRGTLEFLLRRMRRKTDFPSMSAAVRTITRLASSDGGDVNTLSNSILNDFALTNKILRIANSAYYRQFSSGGIATVSRAIVVLGFNTVRNIAMSLLFLEHLQNKPHVERLREEFLRVSLGGLLARRLAKDLQLEPEEALICAQFHRLGRLLSHYYFPEEAEAIDRQAAREPGGEEAASMRVLGLDYQNMGLGIARAWGFPESITQSMYRLPAGKVAAANSRPERLRALSGYANELCEAALAEPAERAAALARLGARYGDSLPLRGAKPEAALHDALEDLRELARIVNIDFSRTQLGRMLQSQPAAHGGALGELGATPLDALAPLRPGEAERETGTAQSAELEPEAVLANGIRDISDALLEERPLGSLLGIALEIMYRAMRFQRVLLCMRDGRSGSMHARFGFGIDAQQLIPRFRFNLSDPRCLFNVVLSHDVDVLISDVAQPKVAPHIPDWHRRELGAQTMLLFPLRMRGVPVGLIYADKEAAGSIVVRPAEMRLLRTLRNQVLLAIKQATQDGGR